MTTRILYIGANSGTSAHRFSALNRLGYHVTMIDPRAALPRLQFVGIWNFKTGGLGLSAIVRRYVLSQIKGKDFDLAWIDQGDLCSLQLLRDLRQSSNRLINYNPDNPYVDRDGLRWRLFLTAIPEYDLIVVPRQSNVDQAYAAGARRVTRVNFAADEIIHRPTYLSRESSPYRSDVTFVGTWMPERGAFLQRLIELNVPLTVYGPRWDKAPEFEKLRPNVSLGDLPGDEYVKAIQGSSIAIGLLSAGNKDLHTTRSIEIPSIGSVLCAQRTTEHSEMYKEDVEALFWTTADECAEKCLQILQEPKKLYALAKAGRTRAISNRNFNEPIIQKIIRQIID